MLAPAPTDASGLTPAGGRTGGWKIASARANARYGLVGAQHRAADVRRVGGDDDRRRPAVESSRAL